MNKLNSKMIAAGLMAVCLSATAVSANAESSDKSAKRDGKQHELRVKGDDRRDGGFKRMGRDERGEKGARGFGPRGMDMGFRQLELTDEQQDKLTAIRDKARKDDWAIRGDMMDVNNKIRDLYRADKFDSKALNKAFAELAELQKKVFLVETSARLNALDLLTDEQRKELREDRPGRKDGKRSDDKRRS